jgi:hypothetical protein
MRFSRTAGAAIALIITAVTLAVPAMAQQICTSKSGRGAYGYSCTGVAPNPTTGFQVEPFAAYGVVTGDGNGQWNGHGQVSFNGTVLPWTHNTRQSEPATVRPDCTGSVTYGVTVAGASVPGAHFEFVIVDGGREIKGFPVDPGYAVTCQLILLQARNVSEDAK